MIMDYEMDVSVSGQSEEKVIIAGLCDMRTSTILADKGWFHKKRSLWEYFARTMEVAIMNSSKTQLKISC